MKVELFVGQSRKGVFNLPNHKINIIGRQADADILLEGDDISRDHLHLSYQNGKIFLIDQGSTCGVFVNDERLPAFKEFEFNSYFQARIGDNYFLSLISHDDDEELLAIPKKTEQAKISEHTKSFQNYKTKVSKKKTKTGLKRKKKSAVKNNWPIYLLILIPLAGAAYYFKFLRPLKDINPETRVESETKVDSEVKVESTNEVNVAIIPQEIFPQPSEISKLWDSSGCNSDQEKPLCQVVKQEWKDKEFISVAETINIFINLTQETQRLNLDPNNEKDNAELILSFYAAHPTLRDLKKEIFVFGFIESPESKYLKFGVYLDPKILSPLDLTSYHSFFSRAFQGEDEWYKTSIKPALILKNL